MSDAASRKPILLLGEQHDQTQHYLIERETLRQCKALGYDTLAIEKPQEYEVPIQNYLRSERTAEDLNAFISATLVKSHLDGGLHPQFLQHLWLAEDAADLGYKVLSIDMPLGITKFLQRKEPDMDWLNRRNLHMANRLKEEVEENGRQIILVTGQAHVAIYEEPPPVLTGLRGFLVKKLSPYFDPPPFSSAHIPLPQALQNRGIESESFILNIEGERERLLKLIKDAQSPAHLITSGKEVSALMQKKLFPENVDFQRVSIPPTPSPAQSHVQTL